MYTDEIYKETVPFSLWKYIMVIMGGITIAFFVLCIYQLAGGTIGSNTVPTWYYLLLFLVFLVISAFLINFKQLDIKITSQSITVRFGILKSIIPWDNINGCCIDDASGISYGGWGLRIARGKGTWIRAYNLTGCPQIVLELKAGKSRRLMFSTKNPHRVLEIAAQQMKK